jgi:hypothetical protein
MEIEARAAKRVMDFTGLSRRQIATHYDCDL